jgi:LPS-assembly protein
VVGGVSLLSGLWASEIPYIVADKPVIFDRAKGESLAEGNAELHYKNLLVQAERIRYISEKQVALAEERVRLNREKLLLVAQQAAYKVKEAQMEVQNFRMALAGHTLEGGKLRGPTEALKGRNVRLYYKEPHPLGLSFDAKRMRVYGDEYIAMRDVCVRLGPVPIFLTPYYRYNLKESTVRLKSDISLIKRDKEFGRYGRNDVLFDFGGPVKPGFMLDGYRKRGVLVGPLLEYQWKSTWGRLKAANIADMDYAHWTDTNNRPLERSRFFFDWQHQTHWGTSWDLLSQVKWQRDSKVVKDFRPDDYDGSRQHPDNFLELAHRGEHGVASLMTRFRPNHFQRIQERLPEFRYDHLPVQLWDRPVYGQWGLGIVHLREKPLLGMAGEEQSSHRLDLTGELFSPLSVGEGFTFTPIVGGRWVNHFGMSSHPDRGRFLSQFGFDLRWKLFGEYDVRNEYWGMDGLRHLFQPVVQYRYIPRVQLASDRLPFIDRTPDSNSPTLEEIDLMNRRDIDSLSGMHLVRCGVENYFYTNYRKGIPKQWLRLNAYQDFRLERKTGETTLSDSFLWTEWAPSDFLGIDMYERFDTTHKRLREATASVHFHEGDLWRYTFSHSYVANSYNQSSIGFSYRLTSRHTFEVSLGLDAHRPDLIRQTYRLSTQLAQTWKVDWEFQWKKRSQAEETAGKEAWEIRCRVMLMEF